jgi:5-methyltetrahydrofolate corrinoid/iron sulfur protein methyltransferase
MLLIGEKINSSRKQVATAILERDGAYIRNEAETQASAGAHFLDVNAGSFAEQEAECLTWLIDTVQEAVELPICVDSPNPSVIRSVLPHVRRPFMINSITLEPARLTSILPVAVDNGAKVIALCQDDGPMASTTEQKVSLAERLVQASEKHGLPLHDLYIDPLVYPLSADASSAMATLDAVEEIMARFPGVHTTCGLSNVSYGLPERKLVNRTFLTAALTRGLDSVMMDPTDRYLYASLKAGLLVAHRDDYCMEYITAYREKRL